MSFLKFPLRLLLLSIPKIECWGSMECLGYTLWDLDYWIGILFRFVSFDLWSHFAWMDFLVSLRATPNPQPRPRFFFIMGLGWRVVLHLNADVYLHPSHTAVSCFQVTGCLGRATPTQLSLFVRFVSSQCAQESVLRLAAPVPNLFPPCFCHHYQAVFKTGPLCLRLPSCTTSRLPLPVSYETLFSLWHPCQIPSSPQGLSHGEINPYFEMYKVKSKMILPTPASLLRGKHLEWFLVLDLLLVASKNVNIMFLLPLKINSIF